MEDHYTFVSSAKRPESDLNDDGMGKSRRYCGGRCVGGPDRNGVVATQTMLAVPFVLYAVALAPYAVVHELFIALLPLVTLPLSSALCAAVALSDPG